MARPTAAAPAAAATAAAPAAAATAPDAPAPAEPTAAVPLDAKAVKVALARAVAYLRRVRPRVSLVEIQVEMGLPKTTRVLGRFLGGAVEYPDQQHLAVFAEWARQHAAPPPQTQVCDGLSPPTMARLLIPLLFSPCPLPLQAYGMPPCTPGTSGWLQSRRRPAQQSRRLRRAWWLGRLLRSSGSKLSKRLAVNGVTHKMRCGQAETGPVVTPMTPMAPLLCPTGCLSLCAEL